jgi:hypothetical protein
MSTIIETLTHGASMTEREATNILVSSGAQFVEVAIRDEPDGPVVMLTDISRIEVVYEVVIGDTAAGDRGKARTIWRRAVTFGATDRTVAGGASFVEAAREQERVAWAALDLLESRRGRAA